MMGDEQLRLEAPEEEAHRLLLDAFREAMREDWRAPGSYTLVLTPGAPAGDEREGTRCGRCGEPCLPFDLTINHDLGYVGCPADRARAGGRHGPMPVARLVERADREAYPDCAACGHPWGLHSFGGQLPCERSCLTYCGCRGYVTPPGGRSPWNTCPGCWAEPHEGPCAPAPPPAAPKEGR
jgi:hypothetical protein